MKAVIIGGNPMGIMTTGILLKRGHEVVIVEKSKARIEELAEEIGCGFVHGDGSKPVILKETDPAHTDFLFCLTDNDQTNIIASLVGRSLGFKRVITKIEDPEFEHICVELGLEDTIIPTLTIGRYLADMLEGQDLLELSAMIRDEARVFSFIIKEQDTGPLGALKLPEGSHVICFYRDDTFNLAEDDIVLKQGDEAIVLTYSRNLRQLQEYWAASDSYKTT